MRIFSLDRVKKLTVTDNTFVYPADFSATDYFADFYGIFVTHQEPENIIIHAYQELPGYLRSLPLHHSQCELETKDGHTDFSLRLVPSPESPPIISTPYITFKRINRIKTL